jgi:hypothetical protein
MIEDGSGAKMDMTGATEDGPGSNEEDSGLIEDDSGSSETEEAIDEGLLESWLDGIGASWLTGTVVDGTDETGVELTGLGAFTLEGLIESLEGTGTSWLRGIAEDGSMDGTGASLMGLGTTEMERPAEGLVEGHSV